jgi:hypothetical protein
VLGLFDVELPSGLQILDIRFGVGSRGGAYVMMSAEKMRDRDDRILLDDRGKPKWRTLVNFRTKDVRERFRTRCSPPCAGLIPSCLARADDDRAAADRREVLLAEPRARCAHGHPGRGAGRRGLVPGHPAALPATAHGGRWRVDHSPPRRRDSAAFLGARPCRTRCPTTTKRSGLTGISPPTRNCPPHNATH